MIKGSVTAKPEAFAAAVKWVGRFVAQRPVVPIQAGIVLDVEDGALWLTGQNENAYARARVPVEGDGAGRAVVSGRLLGELVATLTGKVVDLSGTEGEVVLRAGRFRGTLPTMDEGELPPEPAQPPVIGQVPGEAFHAAIARTAVAAAEEGKSATVYLGVHLRFGESSAVAVATDGRRVATAACPFTPVNGYDTDGTALGLAEPLIGAAAAFIGPDQVTVGLDAGSLSLTTDSRSLTMRLLGEKYPEDVALKLLGQQFPETATVAAADMAGALKRSAIIRASKEGAVRIEFSEGAVTVLAAADEGKQDSDEVVDADYAGPGHEFAFNPAYLGAALSSAGAEKVTLNFSTESGRSGRPFPVAFTATTDPTWRHVVMPLALDFVKKG